MKLRATKKEIREQSPEIIRFGYCAAQTLLQHQQAFAYSAGVNGWSCDYYEIITPDHRRHVISEGYSPIGTVEIPYDIVQSYEKKAQEIAYAGYPWAEKEEKINALLFELLMQYDK